MRIPPPLISDGIANNPAIEIGWNEADEHSIQFFFHPFESHLIHLINSLNSLAQLPPNASFYSLPANYRLFYQNESVYRIHGHPRLIACNLAAKFTPPLLTLYCI
jgi:hypothetical protein